jgi:protein associated with RNAse G/E
VYNWKGELVAETPTSRLVSARFSGADAVPVDKVTFRKDDLMLERYYTDRWYNLFEVHKSASDQVKCWSLNLRYPAQFSVESIILQDLALDLVVYPNGEYRLLDEDEFNALTLDVEVRRHCLETVQDILSAPGLIKPGLVFKPGRSE